MVTAEERLKILQMLQDGKISAEAAAQLLQAMGEEEPQPAPRPQAAQRPMPAPGSASTAERGSSPENRWPAQETPEAGEPGRRPRWLRVRVTDTDTGRPRVNVRLPISLVGLGMKLGAKFTPEIEGLDVQALLEAAQTGDTGAFVDVFDEDDGEHVEVFLE